MKQLLLRADDLGYSEGVNCGIAKSVRDGLIGSVGVMPSMPAASHGLALLEGCPVCLGQHTDICMGRPVSDPALIPSMVDETGCFKSSRVYRAAHARGEDFVQLEEAILESEAQYQKFLDLVGEKPHYFGGHAVASETFFQAMEIVADRHGLKYCPPSFAVRGHRVGQVPVHICTMHSMEPDYDPLASLKEELRLAPEDRPAIFICHPGYLDDFILRNSSLTINRTREVEMLCSEALRSWLVEEKIQLITYDDI